MLSAPKPAHWEPCSAVAIEPTPASKRPESDPSQATTPKRPSPLAHGYTSGPFVDRYPHHRPSPTHAHSRTMPAHVWANVTGQPLAMAMAMAHRGGGGQGTPTRSNTTPARGARRYNVNSPYGTISGRHHRAGRPDMHTIWYHAAELVVGVHPNPRAIHKAEMGGRRQFEVPIIPLGLRPGDPVFRPPVKAKQGGRLHEATEERAAAGDRGSTPGKEMLSDIGATIQRPVNPGGDIPEPQEVQLKYNSKGLGAVIGGPHSEAADALVKAADVHTHQKSYSQYNSEFYTFASSPNAHALDTFNSACPSSCIPAHFTPSPGSRARSHSHTQGSTQPTTTQSRSRSASHAQAPTTHKLASSASRFTMLTSNMASLHTTPHTTNSNANAAANSHLASSAPPVSGSGLGLGRPRPVPIIVLRDMTNRPDAVKPPTYLFGKSSRKASTRHYPRGKENRPEHIIC